MTYAVVFKNGEARGGLLFEQAWSLFMAYRFTSNPCTLSVETN